MNAPHPDHPDGAPDHGTFDRSQQAARFLDLARRRASTSNVEIDLDVDPLDLPGIDDDVVDGDQVTQVRPTPRSPSASPQVAVFSLDDDGDVFGDGNGFAQGDPFAGGAINADDPFD